MPAIFLHNAIFSFAQERQTHIIMTPVPVVSLDKHNLQFVFKMCQMQLKSKVHSQKKKCIITWIKSLYVFWIVFISASYTCVCNAADLHVTGIRGGKKTMKILNRNYYPVEPLMLICGN